MRQRQIECKSEVPSLRALRATYPQVIHSLAYPARHPSIIARFAALVKKYDKIKNPPKRVLIGNFEAVPIGSEV